MASTVRRIQSVRSSPSSNDALHRIVRLVARYFDAPLAVADLPACGRQVWHSAERRIPRDSSRPATVRSRVRGGRPAAGNPDVFSGLRLVGDPALGSADILAGLSRFRDALADDGILVVPDVSADPRFGGSPDSADEVNEPAGISPEDDTPQIYFFAGIALRAPDGQLIGTLSVVDTAPHAAPSPAGPAPGVSMRGRSPAGRASVADALRDFAEMVVDEIEFGASSDRYDRLADTHPDAVLIVADDRIRYANARAAALFGPDRHVLHDASLPALIAPDDRPALRQRLAFRPPPDAPEAESRPLRTRLVTHPRPDAPAQPAGRTPPVELHFTPVHYEGREAWQILVREVTDSSRGRDAEQATQKEALDEARSSAEAAHRAAQEQADALERLKSALLVNVNHELRTPVTAIRLLADTLTDSLSGNELRLCTKILTQTERLNGVLSSLLELSQLENDTVEVSPSRTDLVALVDAVATSTRAALPEDSSLNVVTDLPDTPLTARVDARILRKVLRKCTDNAVKFAPDGTVRIALITSGTTASMIVQDDGVGISTDDLNRVFDPFYQESRGNARDFEGAGLGLTIARELLHRLGGTIALDSRKGEGTRVVIELPGVVEGEG